MGCLRWLGQDKWEAKADTLSESVHRMFRRYRQRQFTAVKCQFSSTAWQFYRNHGGIGSGKTLY